MIRQLLSSHQNSSRSRHVTILRFLKKKMALDTLHTLQ